VTNVTDKILSEFMDAWNAGRRPDVDEYLARAPDAERSALAEDIAAWLTWAPTPAYDAETLAQVRSEPIVAEVVAAGVGRAGLWPSLLPRLRARASVSVGELAGVVSSLLGLGGREERVASYLDRMEQGELDPAGVSSRVVDALARALGVPRDDIAGAGAFGGGGVATAALYRSSGDEPGAGDDVGEHLDVLARAMTAPSPEPWDEVDELFLGGRGER
jgi:hypothetical protein